MATKIRPPKKADVTALLRNLFLRTEQELIREITRKRAAGHVEYAEVAALDRVQKILQNMVDTSWSYVPVMIEKIFYHSDKDAAGYTNARTIIGTRSVTQIAIMEQLAKIFKGSSWRWRERRRGALRTCLRSQGWRMIRTGNWHWNRSSGRRQQESRGSRAVRIL